MARSSGPISLALPPFTGATRRLILANLAVFFSLGVLSLVSPGVLSGLLQHVALIPARVLHGEVWQLVTYAFLNGGILGTALAMLTLWFMGSLLEGMYGTRWLYELYFSSAVGGAVLATALSFAHLPRLSPAAVMMGPYAALFGMIVAIGGLMPEAEFRLMFALILKAKYLAAIWILVVMAKLVLGDDASGALVELCAGVCAYAFVRFAPRRGLAFGITERYFSMRNEYYRSKRRRAARKFEVYMKKQNREVHFDQDGRYVDPDKDPNDKRWMN